LHSVATGDFALLSAGPDGVVVKHFIARDILAAIDMALDDDLFVTPDILPVDR
jgi:DNA-binding NarL/FixJ family response regulator